MADGDTYIDLFTQVEIVQGTPATFDATGFAAMSYVKLSKVLSWPEDGDQAEDVSEGSLDEGRVEHSFGVLDGQVQDITYKFVEGDAGQALLAKSVTRDYNDPWCVKLTDPDGTITYKYGRFGPTRRRERTPSSFKAMITPFASNATDIVVEPA